MCKTTKIVNIYPSMPITTVNPPIRTTVKRVTKSVKEIRACIIARAIVEEVLSNGKTVRLDFSNYNKCLDCTCDSENNCGCDNKKADNTSSTAENDTNKQVEPEKTEWQIAYENALEGKDLGSMSRKQRRAAEASARAAANAAVAESNNVSDIVEETDDTTEDVVVEEDVVEDTVVEEETDVEEEAVQTADVEDMDAVIE